MDFLDCTSSRILFASSLNASGSLLTIGLKAVTTIKIDKRTTEDFIAMLRLLLLEDFSPLKPMGFPLR
jgi:hypothetical protein